jgi:hypothetical protein
MLQPTLTHSRSHSGSSVVNVLDDLRVKNVRPLIPPQARLLSFTCCKNHKLIFISPFTDSHGGLSREPKVD